MKHLAWEEFFNNGPNPKSQGSLTSTAAAVVGCNAGASPQSRCQVRICNPKSKAQHIFAGSLWYKYWLSNDNSSRESRSRFCWLWNLLSRMKMPAQDVEEKLENKVQYSFHINIFTGISHSLDATSTELVSPLLAAYTKENQDPQFKRTALCVTFILIRRYGKKKTWIYRTTVEL